jgi:hypothetical protein
MNQATDFFNAIDAAADLEVAKRLEYHMRRLPKKYSRPQRARLRVLTNTIYSRGAGLEEALEIACRHVEKNPSQSVVEDLRSRFWEKPYPSPANARVLALIRARNSDASKK